MQGNWRALKQFAQNPTDVQASDALHDPGPRDSAPSAIPEAKLRNGRGHPQQVELAKGDGYASDIS